MKKLILGLIVVFFFGFCNQAMGQELVIADQKTIAWDAVTLDIEGDPIPPENIAYNIYRKNINSGEEELIEATTLTSHTITFPKNVPYFIGIAAVRVFVFEDETYFIEGDIAWSNVAEDVLNGNTFMIMHAVKYQKPKNIRVQ